MSAFICGPDLFKALAIFSASHGSFGTRVDPRYIDGLRGTPAEQLADRDLANFYADILYRENVRSVQYRYSNIPRNDLPGPCEDPGHVTISNRDMAAPKYVRVKALWVLKMCDCLDYQSCETDDWRETLAFRLLQSIRAAAVHALPGYDDAPWDYYADEAVKA